MARMLAMALALVVIEYDPGLTDANETKLIDLQFLIDDAAFGSTILVPPGTYDGPINFHGKAVTLRSSSGPLVTVLQGGGLVGSVVTMATGEGPDTKIIGFTITGGTGTAVFEGVPTGGGILIVNAEPTVTDNIFRDNRAVGSATGSDTGHGGAIGCLGLDPTHTWKPVISNNIFHDNQAGRGGGAISAVNYMHPTIQSNTFTSNIVIDGDGGAIEVRSFGTYAGSIAGNTMVNNSAGDHGGGIALAGASIEGLSATLEHNIFVSNSAAAFGNTSEGGGAVWCEGARAVLSNNTFDQNVAKPGTGGAVAAGRRGSLHFTRNIVTRSIAGSGLICNGLVLEKCEQNIFWENLELDAAASCALDFAKDNFILDPIYCSDATGVGGLADTSPAYTLVPGAYIGALSGPQCQLTLIRVATWSQLKSKSWREGFGR